jgi:hypothetical protein
VSCQRCNLEGKIEEIGEGIKKVQAAHDSIEDVQQKMAFLSGHHRENFAMAGYAEEWQGSEMDNYLNKHVKNIGAIIAVLEARKREYYAEVANVQHDH